MWKVLITQAGLFWASKSENHYLALLCISQGASGCIYTVLLPSLSFVLSHQILLPSEALMHKYLRCVCVLCWVLTIVC